MTSSNGLISTTPLRCGMTMVAEQVPNVASAALVWLLPAGSATDARDGVGHSTLLSELILRGAGGKSSREYSDALDLLGVQRGTDVQTHHLRIEATMLADRIPAALPLLVDLVRAPMFPADALEPVKSLALQGLDSLQDDPQHLVMLRLRQRHLPEPFNRHGLGDREVIESVEIDALRSAWRSRALPTGSMIGIAGAIDPKAVADQLNRLLDGWTGAADDPKPSKSPDRGYDHLTQDTSQMHVGVAWDAPREADASSMVERVAVSVLSGSTSGRLFTEVRQKRSLCYSVGASYRAGRDQGTVTLYAGTTPERAQDTLDVCMQEIQRMKKGVTEEEYRRAIIGMKAHQIMQGESTAARAAALVYDQFRLGRARSLDELAGQIDAITRDQLNSHLASRDFGTFTVATIGPEKLKA